VLTTWGFGWHDDFFQALHRACTLNFHRRKADAISRLQNLVGCRGLAIDADQVVIGTPLCALLEELCHSRFGLDLNVIRKARSVIVNVQDFQDLNLQEENGKGVRHQLDAAPLWYRTVQEGQSITASMKWSGSVRLTGC
jgi:hypothetical protein